MRNELVVSFFLCIGLTCGYIVPPSVTEFLKGKNDSNITAEIWPDGKKSKKVKIVNLENAKITLQDSEIYNQGVQKPNNISGRSFIFIRQKYRTPMLNLFHSQIQSPIKIANESTKSIMKLESNEFEELNRKFSPLSVSNAERENTAFKFMSKAIDKTQGILLNQLCSGQLKLGSGYKINKKADLEEPEGILKDANEQREYYELLKTPFLRPNSSKNITVKQEYVQHNYIVTKTPSNWNGGSLTQTSLDLGQYLVRKHNKEYDPYKSKHSFYKNEITHHHESRDNIYKTVNHVSSNHNNGGRFEKYPRSNSGISLNDSRKPIIESRYHYCHECAMRNVNNKIYAQNRVNSDCECRQCLFLKGGSDWNHRGKAIKSVPGLPADTQLVEIKINGRLYGKDDKATILLRHPRFG